MDLFLHRAKVRTVPVDQDQVELARQGWRRFGTGRHPAALNLDDLYAYALARSSGEELLFKGDDFSLTDITRA